MFPTTGHLINAIFGTNIVFPVPTYGLMLSTAFLLAWLVARLEMQRRQKLGLLQPIKILQMRGLPPTIVDLISPALFGFLLGWKFVGAVIYYPEFAKDASAYFFSLQGCWLAGIILAAAIATWEYFRLKKQQLEKPVKETVLRNAHSLLPAILIIAAVGGIAGAKLFHLFENPDEFARDPLGSLFSTAGLTFYGGLITGTLLVAWFCHKKKLDLYQIMDVTAPAILLAYAAGRTGCMLSGDGCWGIENLNPKPEWLALLPDWMWAFNFPHNVVNEGVMMHDCGGQFCRVLENPVYPTSFYETMINLTFFGVLWGLRKKIKIPGLLFALLFIMNGTARFFIEKIRINNTFDLWGMKITQAEVISVLLVITGIILWIFFAKRYKKISNQNE